MDIVPGNIIIISAFVLKTLFLVAAGVIVLVAYFEAKEANKMERKLSIDMPGIATLAISFQLLLSIAFLVIATIVFLFF